MDVKLIKQYSTSMHVLLTFHRWSLKENVILLELKTGCFFLIPKNNGQS